MRCLPDELYPGDTKQSPEEVAAHPSNSGLIYKSEECAKPVEARPTPKAAERGHHGPRLPVTTWKGGVTGLPSKQIRVFSRKQTRSWATGFGSWDFGRESLARVCRIPKHSFHEQKKRQERFGALGGGEYCVEMPPGLNSTFRRIE